MSLLSELTALLDERDIPVESIQYSDPAPDTYCVLTPLGYNYSVFADNIPTLDIEEVRISLYTKGNYLNTKNILETMLLGTDITVTDRTYIGYETDTGYHHYAIDVAKNYKIKEEL